MAGVLLGWRLVPKARSDESLVALKYSAYKPLLLLYACVAGLKSPRSTSVTASADQEKLAGIAAWVPSNVLKFSVAGVLKELMIMAARASPKQKIATAAAAHQ